MNNKILYHDVEELPPIMKVYDIQNYMQYSRTQAYRLVNSKEFAILRHGKTIRIKKENFLEWLNNINTISDIAS